MNCPHCYQALRESARFCDSCGLSVSSPDLWASPKSVSLAQAAAAAAANDSLLGHILDSKYKLTERLGEGGMGAVYRARRIHIGDEVVVKILHRQYVADASAIERFRREARAAAMLSHPNIVTIHDFGEARGTDTPAFIVMELVRGVSLRKLLSQQGKLKYERAIGLMRAICAGVGAAHRKNIFHRDLKPDNIIVLPPDDDYERETVKVVDFGIAKLRDMAATLTQTGTVMGTPYYMSPEQCRGEPLDARSDVYSLGVILYEMLTGKPPFTAETATGVITKHLYEPPPLLPTELNISHVLQAVCIRALAKDPNMRQGDATVLGRELQIVEQRKREEEDSLRFAADERRRKELEEEEARRRAIDDERRRAEEEEAVRRAEEERQQREEAERQRLEEEERQRRAEAARLSQQGAVRAGTDEAERRRLEREVARRIDEINARAQRENREALQQGHKTGERERARNNSWRGGSLTESGSSHSNPVPFIVGFVFVIVIVVAIIAVNSGSSETTNTNSTNAYGSYNSSTNYATTTTTNANANSSSSDYNLALSYYNKGKALFDQKRYSEAETQYREAVRLQPSEAFYHNELGVALAGQKRHTEAESEYREALRLSPNTAIYYDNLGRSLFLQQRYSEAESPFREAARLDPNQVQYHIDLGNCLERLYRYSEARAEYQRALEIDPNNRDARQGLNNVQ